MSEQKAFFDLLDWLNNQDLALKFRVLKILNYGNYGWAEYVEKIPCKNEKMKKT